MRPPFVPPVSLSGHHKLIVHAVVAIFIFIIHFRVIPRLGIDGQPIALQIHISHFTSNIQGITQTPLGYVEPDRIDNRVVTAGKDILLLPVLLILAGFDFFILQDKEILVGLPYPILEEQKVRMLRPPSHHEPPVLRY